MNDKDSRAVPAVVRALIKLGLNNATECQILVKSPEHKVRVRSFIGDTFEKYGIRVTHQGRRSLLGMRSGPEPDQKLKLLALYRSYCSQLPFDQRQFRRLS